MTSIKLRYFLYGMVLSASLASLATQATGPDWVFGDYFQSMINDAAWCWANTAITGFKSSPYGEQECTSFNNLVNTVLKTFGSAPSGQAVIWYDPVTGNPIFGDVNWKRTGSDISYVAGKVGIGTALPSQTLDVQGSTRVANDLQVFDNVNVAKDVNVGKNINVNGNINTTGDVCTTQWGKTVCLDAQKGDPIYYRHIDNYKGIFPTNRLATGVLWQWLKQEWDLYGRIGCQKFKDLYGTWTAADVINCQTAYPWDGNTLQSIINVSISAASALNYLDYQKMWGNPWLPLPCQQITKIYICDWPTQCWVYPSSVNSIWPDYLYFACFGI